MSQPVHDWCFCCGFYTCQVKISLFFSFQQKNFQSNFLGRKKNNKAKKGFFFFLFCNYFKLFLIGYWRCFLNEHFRLLQIELKRLFRKAALIGTMPWPFENAKRKKEREGKWKSLNITQWYSLNKKKLLRNFKIFNIIFNEIVTV